MIKINIISIMLFSLFFSGKVQNIKVGDKVPLFKLPDQNGKIYDLTQDLGKKKLVIYFYPKDESPGCTKEACSFRDQYSSFENNGAKVIGISAQSVESHKEFVNHHKLPFNLLSDKDNKVRKLFGVSTGPIPGRVTFVVDKSGKVIYTFNSLMQAEKHVSEALRVLQSQNKK